MGFNGYMSDGFLEAITYCEEIEADRIGFFPNDTVEHNSLYQQLYQVRTYTYQQKIAHTMAELKSK